MTNSFSIALLQWYDIHKRDLPWRNETDPYKIWISEIILQQTRVAQAWNYYLRFIERFPTIKAIYDGGEHEVLKYWQGLGYYTRARNIYAGTVHITEKHGGVFPENYNDIIQIKGIGEYTAAAIASFAFHLPYPVIDGNVLRVLSRIYGIYEAIDSSSGKKKIKEIADSLLDKKQPDLFNQAIMDFGATHCTPLKPDCENCCFAKTCFANLHYEQTVLPIKIQKTKIRFRYFYYLVIQEKKNIYIYKRTGNDIWKNLFEFPLWETNDMLTNEEILTHSYLTSLFSKTKWEITKISKPYKHVLSHQIISAQFIHIKLHKAAHFPHYICIHANEIVNYPISRLIERYLDTIMSNI